MSLEANMAHSVAERVEEIKQQSGDRILLDDVKSVVDGLIDGIVAEAGAENRQMVSELREALDYVVRAKQEFMSIGPRTLSSQKIPDASEELNAILGATEEAAGQILDAAENLGELAGTVDGPTGEKLQDISTSLFEASAFQDICGQRITKVLAILKFLEGRLTTLAETLGDSHLEEEDNSVEFDADGLALEPEKLTHGPQLETDAISQADVDALLAEFD
jgi:chemotaxis protein CheZ